MDGLKRPAIRTAHCAVSVIDDDADDAKFTNWFLLYTFKSLTSHLLSKKKGPSSQNFMDGRNFPQILLEFSRGGAMC